MLKNYTLTRSKRRLSLKLAFILIALFIVYIALYDFATPKPPIKFQPDKVTFSVNLKQDNLPALSENADYPSPVIQLQQVLSNTYVEEEKVEFPLIDEKLINLSSHSSSSNTQVPEELALLKERINRLQRSE